jgi:hypothetical protein
MWRARKYPHEISQSSRGLCQCKSAVPRRLTHFSGRIDQTCGCANCSQKRLASVRFHKRSPLWAAGVAGLLLSAAGLPAAAEESAVLTRMLRDAQNFKVRAGAAAVIGLRRDSGHRPELEGALADQHPVVRVAAANALGRIGSPASIVPLETATRDRVRDVAVSARAAIKEIETHSPSDDQRENDPSKVRFGLILGEMHDQSAFRSSNALGASLAKNLQRLHGVQVFASADRESARAAEEHGLDVYRVDGSVTTLDASVMDGQISVHGEVTLLVMDPRAAALRTLLRGSAHGVELPVGDLEQQKRGIAQRVVEGAVRSALRNAESAIKDTAARSRR